MKVVGSGGVCRMKVFVGGSCRTKVVGYGGVCQMKVFVGGSCRMKVVGSGGVCRMKVVVGACAEWKWVVGSVWCVADQGVAATPCLNGKCEQTCAHYISTWRRRHVGLNMELNRNRRHKCATLTNASLGAMPVSGSDTIARLAINFGPRRGFNDRL
jgi:hypothetical protein